YRVAPAEATGLPDKSQDLIIAAQALHWFDLDRFFPEVRRLARPGAVFAAISYGLLTIDEEFDPLIGRLYQELLGPYWPPERRHVETGYRTLPFPFRELAAPSLTMSARWAVDQLLGYLSTWSAVREFKRRTGRDPLEEMGEQLHGLWGETETPRTIFWPLTVRAGYVD
ncbi:MAG: methyltransferase domain-containing protein, partial [Desulfuromonadaceae bacterium]